MYILTLSLFMYSYSNTCIYVLYILNKYNVYSLYYTHIYHTYLIYHILKVLYKYPITNVYTSIGFI